MLHVNDGKPKPFTRWLDAAESAHEMAWLWPHVSICIGRHALFSDGFFSIAIIANNNRDGGGFRAG
jgi:hypothetical protein